MTPQTKQRRKKVVIALSTVVVILFAFAVIQQAFNLTPYLGAPERQITLLLWALTSLNVILLTIFSLILLRNLLKLYFERRSRRLGSKFRTKLVFSFLGLSLIPVIFMSLFSYFLLHRNLDKWFSFPIDHLLESVNQIAEQLRPDAVTDAYLSARYVANHPALKEVLNTRARKGIDQLQRVTQEYAIPIILILDRDRNPLYLITPNGLSVPMQPEFRRLTEAFGLLDWSEGRPRISEVLLNKVLNLPESGDATLVKVAADGKEIIFSGSRVFSEGSAPVASVVIACSRPANIANLFDQISRSRRYYSSWSQDRKIIRYNYLLWLGLITLLILFAAVWIGLFLSRRITIPIQALAEAANEVSRGNLMYQVKCPAEDELGILVSSFNRMTAQLYESSRRLEQTNRDLQDSNRALQERRRYTEAVLENIPTGVISIGPNFLISAMNSAAQGMLGCSAPAAPLEIDEVFRPADAGEIRTLIAKASRVGVAAKDLQLRLQGRKLYVAATISSLDSKSLPSQGFVMVLEDLTEVLKSQKANAWREVARRMAHEIKNPLTPIQLSAERLLKNYTRCQQTTPLAGEPEKLDFGDVLRECVQTISTEVSALKGMVDEFSRFARLPSAHFVPSSLNAIIENALASYNGRFQEVTVIKTLSPDLPEIKLDPDQFKRVLVNLFDNALEAMESSHQKELTISSKFSPQKETVELVVKDTGHGIPAADKEKLFLPYFSTRKRGTGLGLAIVSRIVADHKGYVHVEDNTPCGTRVVIEIPAT